MLGRGRVAAIAVALALGGCCNNNGMLPPQDAGPEDAGCRYCQDGPWPDVPSGECTAAAPTPEALVAAGAAGAGTTVIPGGRRITPAGMTFPLSGFPMAMKLLPLAGRLLVTDGSYGDEYLRMFDATTGAQVAAVGPYTLGSGDALFLGLAVTADESRIYASGGGHDVVHVIDRAGDTLTAGPDIAVQGYVAGLALTPDESTLLVIRQKVAYLAFIDTTTNLQVGSVNFDSLAQPYDVVVSADGLYAYVSLWGGSAVGQVRIADRTVVGMAAVGKNPEGMVLSPDGTRLYAACADDDTIAVLDPVTMAPIATWSTREMPTLPSGSCPSAVALDAAGARLFVTDACENAIDVLSTADGSRVGRIPTGWWPTDVEVSATGTLYVTTGKGIGTGPNPSPGGQPIDRTGGSLAILAPPTDPDLATGFSQVEANNSLPATFTSVTCPPATPYDFPLPEPGAGPSPVIQHVVLIVRENKTYDAELSDLPAGNGDPTLLLWDPTITPNTHALATEFTNFDNFYADSEASIQGHVWTTTGRTTDYVERTWLTIWGRATRSLLDAGGTVVSQPEIGLVFDVLETAGIDFTVFGEGTALLRGAGMTHMDRSFPSIYRNGAYDTSTLDVDKANYLAHLVRDVGLPTFWYISLPNDHTEGTSPGYPTPESMVADNDAGTGIILDAIAHSVFWPSTVVILTEDDPQDGGDHVDAHRSICVVISPWARRGYVSNVHSDFASIHRTIELLLGLPPMSQFDARAAAMYDAFTNVPDLTPFDARPRQVPMTFNAFWAPGAMESAGMDFSGPDRAQGLARVLWWALRGTEPPWQPNWRFPLPAAPGTNGADSDGDEDGD